MEYYIVKFLFQEHTYYTIWILDDINGFVMESGSVKLFESQKALEEFCIERAMALGKDVTSYDGASYDVASFDVVKLYDWADSKNSAVDCKFILDFWNIIDDLSIAMGKNFLGNDDRVTHTYTKLFAGTNPATLNNTGVMYEPTWSDEELDEIHSVMSNGLEIIKEAFGIEGI
jgi:hypothetical protein